jgi:hypothetical protein
MITEVKMYSATCDNCNELHENNHTGFTAFADEEALTQSANYQGWTFTDGKCYCKSCHYFDDNDKMFVNDNCN